MNLFVNIDSCCNIALELQLKSIIDAKASHMLSNSAQPTVVREKRR